MQKRFTLFLLLLVACPAMAQQKITTFILIRHAEKASDGTQDPDLRKEGTDRAAALVKLLHDTPVSAIYSTNYKRTRQTVTPLASDKGLDVQVYEPFKENVITDMLAKHAGQTVVVCGHSNNIPWIANLLQGEKTIKDYDDAEYGIMLIVAVEEKGKNARVIRINY